MLMNIASPGNQVYNQNNVRCVINWTKLLIVFTRSSERWWISKLHKKD